MRRGTFPALKGRAKFIRRDATPRLAVFVISPTRLTGKEGQAFAKQNLIQRKVDDVSWKVLWENPETGEFWKEYFPESELHG